MQNKEALSLIFRYSLVILLGLFNLYIFYLLFTPLTVYTSYFILSFLKGAQLVSSNTLYIEGYYARIIPACVAGSAYYFLFILNMTTPLRLKTRIQSLSFLLGVFFLLNVLRIVLFAYLATVGYQYFDFAHEASWYFGSTILVILLWFSNVLFFKIKSIPVYTELKSLFSDLKKV